MFFSFQITQMHHPSRGMFGLRFSPIYLYCTHPDGKIYITRYGIDTLAVINNPNNSGASCNFQYNSIGFPVGVFTYFGLPNFIDANYVGIQLNIPDIQQCNGFVPQIADAGAGFVNYFWNTGANTQTVVINNPGKYWVTVTNTQGCTRTDTISAYILKPLKLDTLACDSFQTNIIQEGVLTYNWFDGNHNPTRNFKQSGNYYVDIAYVNGCSIRDSINLIVVPSPTVNLGSDTAFCLGNLNLDALNPTASHNWSTGQNTQSIKVTNPGTYWVHLVNSSGCKAADTLIVQPQLSVFNFSIPNIVTPNNDNINDFIDFGILQCSTLQLEIYNRWGIQIFESSDPKCIWKPNCEDGTYFYSAQYRIDCGADTQTKNSKGFITLIK